MKLVPAFVLGLLSLGPAQVQSQAPYVRLAIVKPEQLNGTVDLVKVREWIAAVQAHQPGQGDDGLKTVVNWPAPSLAVTITDAVGLLRLAPALNTQGDGAKVSYRHRTFRVSLPPPPAPIDPSVENLFDALQIKEADVRHGLVNRLLERGAMLQTDLAIYVSLGGHANVGAVGAGSDVTIHVADGEVTSTESSGPYWRDARFVVDAINRRPEREADPRREPLVSLWYRATSAWAASQGRWSDAHPLLERGLALFPHDERLLFDAGVLHEVFSEHGTQHAAQNLVRAGATTSVVSEETELQLARDRLESALAEDDELAEARLHLGRVLGRQGRHETALGELTRAEHEMTDRELRYDAAMLLAREQAATGDREAARASYGRAARLFPAAQSPQVGLSELSRLDGDGPAAMTTLAALLGRSATQQIADDPWWSYTQSQSRDAIVMMAVMRAAFMKGDDQ